MEKFFPENYRQTIRDIQELFTLLATSNLESEFQCGLEDRRPTADALLMAAVEIWKHQNPWIQREYGETEEWD